LIEWCYQWRPLIAFEQDIYIFEYAFPLLLMNRLSQTESAIFWYLSCSVTFKVFLIYFQTYCYVYYEWNHWSTGVIMSTCPIDQCFHKMTFAHVMTSKPASFREFKNGSGRFLDTRFMNLSYYMNSWIVFI
jgi:hypothetical protein